MKSEIEKFSAHRELLTRISDADSAVDVRRELSELSKEDQRFIFERMMLASSDWEGLLNTLSEEDSELSVIVQSAREAVNSVVEGIESDEPFRFSSQIQAVAASPYLGLGNGVPYIRLIFKTAGGETIHSDQDLEDTLGIGTAVLQSVAESAQSMIQTLGIPPDRIAWGDEFEARLALAEEFTRTLRSLYDQHIRREGETVFSSEEN